MCAFYTAYYNVTLIDILSVEQLQKFCPSQMLKSLLSQCHCCRKMPSKALNYKHFSPPPHLASAFNPQPDLSQSSLLRSTFFRTQSKWHIHKVHSTQSEKLFDTGENPGYLRDSHVFVAQKNTKGYNICPDTKILQFSFIISYLINDSNSRV